jgi:polysaccharide pyruvyl transferase WcaK-like protein
LLAGRALPPNPAQGTPYLVVQALGFADVAATTAALRRIAKATGLRVVLLPLTRCWQDHRPLGALQKASDGEFILVDDATADLDKLAILGGATLYVGQSMHGLIGALSQCRPGGICLPDADDKFGELLRDLDFPQFRSTNWDGVEALVQTLLWSPPGLIAQRRAAAEQRLDTLFDEIAGNLVDAVKLRPRRAG